MNFYSNANVQFHYHKKKAEPPCMHIWSLASQLKFLHKLIQIIVQKGKIEECFKSRKGKNLTFTCMDPVVLYISPKTADNKDDFPEPTGPITTTKLPLEIFKSIFCNLNGDSSDQYNEALFMVITFPSNQRKNTI